VPESNALAFYSNEIPQLPSGITLPATLVPSSLEKTIPLYFRQSTRRVEQF